MTIMKHSEKDRIRRVELMYAAISSATAEIKNAQGESERLIYVGTVPNLFKGIDTNTNETVRFLWAVSHKTNSLPNVLFEIKKLAHGIEVKRFRSGFYRNDNRNDKIAGNDLIPFIVAAMKEYKPTPRAKKVPAVQQVELPKQDDSLKFKLQEMSSDELTRLQFEIQKEFERRARIRKDQERLQQALDLMEMSKEELAELLKSNL